MPSLRPLPNILRPSICELASFLFLPHKLHTSCASNYARRNATLTRRGVRAAVLTRPRSFSTAQYLSVTPKPKNRDRGPPSTENTQTDFGNLDVLGSTPAPSTSIDACLWDGFHLDNGMKITDGSGVLLIAGEAFTWRPWENTVNRNRLVNDEGQWEVPNAVWGVFDLCWPKPDLLILGLGRDMRPISPITRRYLGSLGIRIDIQDTRNAAAQFNLLATERGVGTVAAALIPIGWREGSGVQ